MNVKRIQYERTGGFTGMRFHADFKPADLPEEQSRPLLDLLERMNFNSLPENLTGDAAHPDQFNYTITVESDQGRHTVVAGDASASNDMQELTQLLDRISRTQR